MTSVEPITSGLAMRFLRRALATTSNGTPFSHLLSKTLIEMVRAGELEDTSPSFLTMELAHSWRQAMDRAERPNHAVPAITAAFFELVALGYVCPSPHDTVPGNIFFGALIVTDRGREWANGAEPIPEDSAGYLAAFDKLVPSAHAVIRQYVAEAVRVYNGRSFFAAAVMLGAASEASVYHLAEAVAAALTNPTEKKNLQGAIKDHAIADILNRISGVIARVKKRPTDPMPHSVSEAADAYLLALLESIRVQRNEAGHPQTAQVEPVAVRILLSTFPDACRKVYDLASWFAANPV